jgi:hypothetical protein
MIRTSASGRPWFFETSFPFCRLDHGIVEFENLEEGHVCQLLFRGFPGARVADRHLGTFKNFNMSGCSYRK